MTGDYHLDENEEERGHQIFEFVDVPSFGHFDYWGYSSQARGSLWSFSDIDSNLSVNKDTHFALVTELL